MSDERESVFKSILRAFFVTFFRFLGFSLALVVIVLVIFSSSMNTKGETHLDLKNTIKILPDAEGNLKKLDSSSPAILEINLHGVIGVGNLTMQKIRRQLLESRLGDLKDDRVKGIFLDISTPGGTVIDSEGIFQALKDYKKRYNVPVFAYVDGLCASGGVYVSSAADKIYASDVSLIGSVGVIMPTFFNLTQLLDKLGVQSVTLIAGKGKDEMNPFRPWKKGEEEHYQSIADFYYANFVDIVTANRPISKDLLINEYGAKVFPAALAKERGYIDQVEQSRNTALKLLVTAAGLEDQEYQVVQFEETKWFAGILSGSNALFTGKIQHQFQGMSELEPELMEQFLYLYRPGK